MSSVQRKTPASFVKTICLFLSGAGVGWLIGLSVSPIIHVIITSLIALVVSVTGALAGINIRDGDSAPESGKPKRKIRVDVDPVPLMFMVIGIVIGSSVGVYVRTNGWLGPNPATFVEKWKDTELTKKEISRRLFDELYPPRANSASTATGGSSSLSGPQSATSSAGSLDKENSNSDSAGGPEHNGSTTATQPSNKDSGTSGGKSAGSSESAMSKSMVSALFSNVDADDCAQFRTARDENLRGVMESGVGSNEQARQTIRQCPDIKCLRELVRRICSE